MVNSMKNNSIMKVLIFVCCFFVFGGSVNGANLSTSCSIYNDSASCRSHEGCMWSPPIENQTSSNYCYCDSKKDKTCTYVHSNNCKSSKTSGECGKKSSYCSWTSYCVANPNYNKNKCSVSYTSAECTRHGYTWDSNTNCCNTSSKSSSNGVTKGGFCGDTSGLSAWKKSQGVSSDTVTKSQCNAGNDKNWRSDWSSSNNCCSLSKRKTSSNTGSNKTNTSSNTTTTNSVTNYQVLFDQNYGYGLECSRGTEYYSDGICSSKVKKNNMQAFPINSTDNKLIRNGSEYLIGWTRDVIEGKPVCAKGYINKSTDTDVIISDTVYYACYTEDIGGYRYLKEGAEIDKPDGLKALECGDEFWVDYCTRNSIGGEICYGTREGVLRKIDRSLLAETTEGAACSMAGINKYYYATTTNSDFSCGEAIYITSCDDTTCTYNKVSKFD